MYLKLYLYTLYLFLQLSKSSTQRQFLALRIDVDKDITRGSNPSKDDWIILPNIVPSLPIKGISDTAAVESYCNY